MSVNAHEIAVENNVVEKKLVTIDKIVITDIKVPLWSLVVLMIKIAIAAIPAAIIIAIIYSIAGGLIYSLLPALFR
jgi:hypothetical protein